MTSSLLNQPDRFANFWIGKAGSFELGAKFKLQQAVPFQRKRVCDDRELRRVGSDDAAAADGQRLLREVQNSLQSSVSRERVALEAF